MELKIKASVGLIADIGKVVKLVQEIEKEYSSNCTLLKITVNPLVDFQPYQSEK